MIETDLYSGITAASILVVSLLIGKWAAVYFFKLLNRLTRKTNASMLSDAAAAFEKPIRVLVIIVGVYLALKTIGYEPGVHPWVNSAFRSIYVLLLMWGLIRFTGVSSHWMERIGERFNFEVDRILLPFLSKIIRLIVICLGFTVIVQEWGYEVTGFIAGLGLGGLAFALAAKDALSNIFGGIVIITEKPFSLDDWIDTPSVEGTVENISFRSTRIRTFAQALVTVPNSTLANEPITNWSRMGKRRITFHLGLTYSTTREQMETCLNEIREMLLHHPDIHQETVFVHLDKFGPSSLDVFFYFFTATTQWGEWLRVKEDCLLKILEILEKEGVSIALPSTSVYVESPARCKVDNTASNERG